MNIEELVRAEFRSVADQVVTPAMPALDEQRRRTWAVVIAAAAAAALVIGGLTVLLRDSDEEPPVVPPKRVQISRSAPNIPWLDGEKLYVGGRQVPGRWGELVTGGDTWLARRHDRHVFWGRGGDRHDLGEAGETFGASGAYPLRGHGPFLSPNGRYLALTTDAGGARPFRLLDTTTGRARTVRIPVRVDDSGATGVTNEGMILGPLGLVEPGKGSRPLDKQGGRVEGNGAPGFVLHRGEYPAERTWVVDIEGSTLRRVAEVTHASLSPDHRWLLDLAWADDEREPAAVRATALDTGDSTSIPAPRGWVFAPRLAPGFWEPGDTLVLFVVRPDSRAYRTVRCAPVLAKCVFVEGS